jgi:hypothetical protein
MPISLLLIEVSVIVSQVRPKKIEVLRKLLRREALLRGRNGTNGTVEQDDSEQDAC